MRNYIAKKSSWTENIKDNYKYNEPQMYEYITVEEIINKLEPTYKWKISGRDKTKLLPPHIINKETYFKNHLKKLNNCLIDCLKK